MLIAFVCVMLSMAALYFIQRGLNALADRLAQKIGIKPLVLTFSKLGELLVIADGVEKKAPSTIHVRQWQEVHFVHNSRHAEFKIDRAAANDLFLQYQGTEQRGEDTIEKYEVFNYGTTFYLHVDVDVDSGKKHKAIPFEVEPDTP
jgi:deoxyribodipyrimidine photolyase